MMKEKLKRRCTSKVVWLTAIALVANLIAMYVPDVADGFTQISTTIVSLLALFGILNNPDDKEEF